MPKIPVQEFPDVQPGPAPGAHISLDTRGAFGEQVGQAIQGIGQKLGQSESEAANVYATERRKADDAATTDGLTKLQAGINDLQYNPDYGLRRKQGEAAMAGAQDVYENINKLRDQISSSLTNDSQRQAFAEHANHLIMSATGQVEEYVGQQKHVADEATLRARQEQGLTAVIGDYSNEHVAATQYAQVADSIRKLQLSPEDGDAKMAQWRSDLASARIRAAIRAGDPDYGEKLFDATRDELGPRAAQVGEEIKVLQQQRYGQLTARQVVQAATDPKSGLVHDDKIQPQVDALPDGPRKAAVIQSLNAERIEAERANQAIIKAHTDDALRAINVTHNLNSVPADTAQWLNAYAPDKWRAIQRDVLSDQRAARTSSASERRDEAARQKTLLDTFKGGDPKDVAKADIDQAFLGQGASDDTKSLARMFQNKVKATLAKGGMEDRSTFESTVQAEEIRADIKPKSPRAVRFGAFMNDWWANQEQKPGRSDVMKAIGDALQYSKGGILSSGKFQFETKPGETFEPAPAAEQKYPPNRTPKAAPLPPGVKLGKDGKPYQKGPNGWVPFSG